MKHTKVLAEVVGKSFYFYRFFFYKLQMVAYKTGGEGRSRERRSKVHSIRKRINPKKKRTKLQLFTESKNEIV